MDAFADLLGSVRARGAVFCQSIASPPWALRVVDPPTLSLATMLRGQAWFVPSTGEPVRVTTGDVVVTHGREQYAIADDPDSPTQVVISGAGADACTTPDGLPLLDRARLGSRTWGFAPDGAALLVTGAYQLRGDVSERLLAALPNVLVVPAGCAPAHVLDLESTELTRDAPGQEVVLDRLLDLLLVLTLRAWFGRPEADPPGWYRALGDPVVGRALRAMHDDPARHWTVASLAREVDLSRAAFARRFTALVGEPPLTYLTSWRMALAADLLSEPDTTVSSVAHRVGYTDGLAFSVAFKRTRGISPTRHRADVHRHCPPPLTTPLTTATDRSRDSRTAREGAGHDRPLRTMPRICHDQPYTTIHDRHNRTVNKRPDHLFSWTSGRFRRVAGQGFEPS